MKILYVIHDNKKGGAALSFLEMIKGVNTIHEVFVLTPHKKGFLPEQLDKLNIPYSNAHYFWWIVACPENHFLKMLKINLYRVLDLINHIESIRISHKYKDKGFNLIHSNASVINFGGLLAKRMKIPHVWHIREYSYEGCNLFPIHLQDRINCFMRDNSSCIITISKALQYRYQHDIENCRVVNIYNGINNITNYQKKVFVTKDREVRFLIAGYYTREKGQIDVARAVIRLVEQNKTNFIVYMAGSGDFGEIRKLIGIHQLEKYIRILGQVDDMCLLRKNMDIEIVASRCEAFGRVTVEAMKSSNPVIGTNAGGTVELINEGNSGFLFEYADDKALAEKMSYFIEHTDEIERMGKQAYLGMRDAFSTRENVQKILELYDGIVLH